MSGGVHVKRVRALHRRQEREAQGVFLVQGRKLIAELLASGHELAELFAAEAVAREMNLPGARVVPAKDLERMGTFEQGNEVVAVVRKPRPVRAATHGREAFLLAVDGVSDPGNMGTLLRIADWFGAAQLWCSPESVEVWNPKCVQASMGSIFRVPVVYGDLGAALAEVAQHGAHVYKAEASGANVFKEKLARPAVLVLGSESHGLSKTVREGPGRSIAIPAFGGAESLNVAAAAAALCMEFARQGGGRGQGA